MTGALALAPLLALLLAAQAATAAEDAPLHDVVVVGQTAAAALGDRVERPALAARALPREPRHYGRVSALVIDGHALARLDEAQLRALLEYAGGCGRLMLVSAPGDAGYVLARRAGCGGRFVATATPHEREYCQR